MIWVKICNPYYTPSPYYFDKSSHINISLSLFFMVSMAPKLLTFGRLHRFVGKNLILKSFDAEHSIK